MHPPLWLSECHELTHWSTMLNFLKFIIGRVATFSLLSPCWAGGLNAEGARTRRTPQRSRISRTLLRPKTQTIMVSGLTMGLATGRTLGLAKPSPIIG